jgi:hypothetical protein
VQGLADAAVAGVDALRRFLVALREVASGYMTPPPGT